MQASWDASHAATVIGCVASVRNVGSFLIKEISRRVFPG
jgi:hypothetical protein